MEKISPDQFGTGSHLQNVVEHVRYNNRIIQIWEWHGYRSKRQSCRFGAENNHNNVSASGFLPLPRLIQFPPSRFSHGLWNDINRLMWKKSYQSRLRRNVFKKYFFFSSLGTEIFVTTKTNEFNNLHGVISTKWMELCSEWERAWECVCERERSRKKKSDWTLDVTGGISCGHVLRAPSLQIHIYTRIPIGIYIHICIYQKALSGSFWKMYGKDPKI